MHNNEHYCICNLPEGNVLISTSCSSHSGTSIKGIGVIFLCGVFAHKPKSGWNNKDKIINNNDNNVRINRNNVFNAEIRHHLMLINNSQEKEGYTYPQHKTAFQNLNFWQSQVVIHKPRVPKSEIFEGKE